MKDIYCLKCKDHTENLDYKIVITKNNRNRVKATCAVCKKSKSRMLGMTQKGGFIPALPFHKLLDL